MSKLTTADCKAFLTEFGSATWKRKRKAKDDDGHVLRVFTDGTNSVVIDSGLDDTDIVSAVLLRNVYEVDLNALKDPGRPWMHRTAPTAPTATTAAPKGKFPREVVAPLHEDWHDQLDPGEPVPQSSTEFVFDVMEFDGSTMASVCLLSYWKKYGHLDDRSFANQYVDPLGFYELMESEFEFEGTVEEARKILREAGMKEDPKFSAFMRRCHG